MFEGRVRDSLLRRGLALVLLAAATPAFAQNIIVNGSFNSNVASWALDPGFGSFQWSSDGTLLLINDAPPTSATASVSQCDSISAGVSYDLSAKVQPLNFGQGGPSVSGPRRLEHTGSIYVLLDFYPLDGCRGSALPQFVRVEATGGNIWQAIGQSFFAPASAASVLTSLAILKNQSGSDLQAEFDEISIAPSGGPPPAPVANFTYAPGMPVAGDAVQFTDTTLFNPTSWSWNFDDSSSGSLDTSSVRNPAHRFAAPGVYAVTLTASNAGGSSSQTHSVTVASAAPVANFVFTPAAPTAGVTVQFNDTSTGGPTSWSWSFGDPGSGASNTSTSRNPSHVFAAPGVYTVTLSASNAGATGLRNHAVTVASAAPVANFTFDPASPAPGMTVQFDDVTTGGPTAWSWDFGDPDSGAANTSSEQNPAHVFSRSGAYTVTLTASNAMGTATVSADVNVKCLRCPRVVHFR